MSFIMIAAGPAGCSRIRTVSVRTLLIAGGLAGGALMALGAGFGYWAAAWSAISTPVPVVAAATAERPRAALPFAIEQLGALSGRLFKLESQAGQLSERIRALGGGGAASPKPGKGGSGGPLLAPRPEPSALGTIDEIDALSARLAQIEARIAQVSDAASLQHEAQMRMPSHVPVDRVEIASPFGNREDPMTGRRAFHAGLDFAAASGTTIHAAAAGTVVFAGFRSDYGWVVEIDHGNGLTTRYAHASRLFVRAGALVTPGDAIAAVGSTGRSTGPHLHFEVLRNGAATDPRRYLAGL
jgi:murein DD-endopeptidase MepM/ murein hydrolase activator NlpD